MPYTKTLDILKYCRKNRFSVGAFNITGLGQPSVMIKKADELKSPLLITIPGMLEQYMDLKDVASLTKRAAQDAKIPVGLHMSHSLDLNQFERAVKAGFTSIMFDGSLLPYEENVRNTKEAVNIASSYGIAVEGEIGTMPGTGGMGIEITTNEATMTEPDLAKEFVEKTGVDILAVSIGNKHAMLKGSSSIELERLRKICKELKQKNVYLTLHGGTGIPIESVKKCIEIGVVKICIYTVMCKLAKERVEKYIEKNPGYNNNFEIPNLIETINSGFVDAMENCMRNFGSVNSIGESDIFKNII